MDNRKSLEPLKTNYEKINWKNNDNQTHTRNFFSKIKKKTFLERIIRKIAIYYIICLIIDIIVFVVEINPHNNIVYLDQDSLNNFYLVIVIQTIIYYYLFTKNFSVNSNEQRFLYLVVPTIHLFLIVIITLLLMGDKQSYTVMTTIFLFSIVFGCFHMFNRIGKILSLPMPQKGEYPYSDNDLKFEKMLMDREKTKLEEENKNIIEFREYYKF